MKTCLFEKNCKTHREKLPEFQGDKPKTQVKMKARTQDERYIIALYELSKESDDDRFPVSKYAVGEKISMNPRGVNAICKLLLQANFIKKLSEEEIYITENGASLAKRLLDE